MQPCLLLHGGAGTMDRLDEVGRKAYRRGLREALEAGIDRLPDSALDAVVAAVRSMEADGVFNAGRGSCLNRDGEVEMDAAIMEGTEGNIGAFGGAGPLADPMGLALAILQESPHVLLVGGGATDFARQRGLQLLDPPASEQRLREYGERKQGPDHWTSSGTEALRAMSSATGQAHDDSGQHDTVGAVAMDAQGRTAVAVSTGGIWLKLPGRVGDSPIPGAGYWAEDGVGAVCATGTGEVILRMVLCRQVVERLSAGSAAHEACGEALRKLEGRFGTGLAGLIAIDAEGRPGIAFHTSGMGHAAYWRGQRSVGVFPGESQVPDGTPHHSPTAGQPTG
jgi:beta-aspartyl-peptidase (threonine type)